MSRTKTPRAMSDEHKAELDKGRRAGAAVRSYLHYAAQVHEPKRRGRPGKPADVVLAEVELALAEATDPVERLKLIARKREAKDRLLNETTAGDLAALERGFVDYAAWFSVKHGIVYADWRELGVSADLLKRAGISRAKILA